MTTPDTPPLTIADIIPGVIVDVHIVFAVNDEPVLPLHLTLWEQTSRVDYDDVRRHLLRELDANLEHLDNPLRLRYLAEKEARRDG
ncbi:hypothetical protein [Rhodococcus koreensis]|uniref:hypothetical protein n=1 Tax=Rhodococcus koreensis TaxID=99653 RepID=UPI0036DC12A4